jgi:O-acetylserine/cysteine efflux transporter
MPLTHLALVLLVMLIWGCNFVVIDLGLKEVSPLLLVCTRFFLTSIPAIFFVKRPATSLARMIQYGLIMLALPFTLLFLGMNYGVTAGLASLLFQVQVFFTVLFAMIIFKEKLHLWHILGAVLSFSGIVLVARYLESSASTLGFFLVIAGAASWGAGNVVSKRIGRVNMVSLVVWGSLFAWPPLLLLTLAIDGPSQILHTFTHLTWTSGGAILYITYLSTLLCFVIWSWLVHHHPLPTIAPFTLLVPTLGFLSSAWILGEPLQSWKIIAALLVVSGLGINLFGPKLLKRK